MTIRQMQRNGDQVEVCLCPPKWRGHPKEHRFFSAAEKVPLCLVCVETGEVPLECLFKCSREEECKESRKVVEAFIKEQA